MSLRYQAFSKKPRLFRQITTLTVEEFNDLVKRLKPEWREMEVERLNRSDRKNVIGQGHPYFGTFEDLILLLIVYTRTSCSNALIGLLFEITETTVITLGQRLLPLLQDKFIPITKVRKKRGTINTLDDLTKEYPGIKEVIVDGTGIAIRRPKRRQKKNYSGKSRKHEKKAVIVVNPKDGIILSATKLRSGAIHDKRILTEDPR